MQFYMKCIGMICCQIYFKQPAHKMTTDNIKANLQLNRSKYGWSCIGVNGVFFTQYELKYF